MKRLTLFLSTLLLMVIGVLGVHAQASYNYAYTSGSTVAAGGNYFLYNIGSGMFLTDGMDFGTHASADHAGRVLTLAAATNGYSIYTTHVSANGTDDKPGYLTTNGYVDTGTNDADWVFTPVTVSGYTNAYTIKNSDTQYLYYETKDGLYNGKAGQFINVGSSTGDAYSYWLLIPMSARQTVNDYTYLLRNTDFCHPWELPVWNNTATWTNYCGGDKSNTCAEMYHAAFDVSQTISATVDNGKYVLHNQGFYRADAGSASAASLYANSDETTISVLNANGEGTTQDMAGASTSFSAGLYTNSVTTVVTDGTLKVGIKTADANNWVIFDNFYLEYLGPTLSTQAVEFTSGSTMAADTWYYYNVTSSTTYNLTAGSALGDIVYYDSSAGSTLVAEATAGTAFSASAMDLAVGYLYIKSSTAQTLTIEPNGDVLGTPTLSVEDGSYYGSATAPTFVATYSNAVSALHSLSILDDTKKATLAKDGGSSNEVTLVADNSAKTLTADFSALSLDANSDYTITIPAGAFGYEDASNDAISITFHTPALLDGTYYFKASRTWDGSLTYEETAAMGKYLSRGAGNGTHATLDAYGLPIAIVTDANNVSTLSPQDTKRYYYHSGSWQCWADNASAVDAAKFTVTLADGKYRIHNNSLADGTYLKYNNADVALNVVPVYDDGTGTNSGPIIEWVVESAAEHLTAMTTLKNTQATEAATAAGLSSTTPADLKTAAEALTYNNSIISATTPSTTAELYQGTQPGNSNNPINVLNQSIQISVPGLYKFSIQAYYRAAANATAYPLHTAGYDMPPVYVFFGDAQTQIKSVYDESSATTLGTDDYNPATGEYYPNSQAGALAAFTAGMYNNDVWVYISTPGTYEYGIRYTGWANAIEQWCCWTPESMSLTLYSNSPLPGMDMTSSYITNPGFEDDAAVVTYGNTLTGWDWPTTPTKDTGVYETSNATYATGGSTGSYLFNEWYTGYPLTQNIGVLPAGVYQLSADVATGNSISDFGTVYLGATLNGTTTYSTGYTCTSNKMFQNEKVCFVSDGTNATTISLRGGGSEGNNASYANDRRITKAAVNDAGWWWFKTDNWQLHYVADNTQEALYAYLYSVINGGDYAPYNDVTDVTDYTTNYETYAAYTASNTTAELITAIDYITNEYKNYLWQNASETHPVDVTDLFIKDADCEDNDSWYIGLTGRSTATATDETGTSRKLFTQNVESDPRRGQTITLATEGAYKLVTQVCATTAAAYASIGVSDGTEDYTAGDIQIAYGSTTTAWTELTHYISATNVATAKTIYINLSNANSSRTAYCSRMKLYYIGRQAVANDYVHYGLYHDSKTVELTDAAPIVDTRLAGFENGLTLTYTNPNGVAYIASGQASSQDNQVIDGTCATLSLSDGHPVEIPEAFTATAATYTRSAVANDGTTSMGTLILPFTVTSLPEGCQVYTAIAQSGTTLKGLEQTTIAANTPVIITAAGTFTGSNASVAATSATTTYTTGELVGVYSTTSAPNNSYVLQNHTETTGSGVAFYLVDTEVATPSVSPFRAYIAGSGNSASAPFLKFMADGEETGISLLTTDSEQAAPVIYDMQGRRLQRITRAGVYIVNGKKTMIK